MKVLLSEAFTAMAVRLVVCSDALGRIKEIFRKRGIIYAQQSVADNGMWPLLVDRDRAAVETILRENGIDVL